MTCRPIGDFIKLVDSRNVDLLVKNLLGINISKNFMPSVANANGLDLSKYKIIKKGQFAMNVMHVGRDEKLPISLYSSEDPAIVSPAYFTFEITDENFILPEYLMLQFIRPEFDRLTWYYCDSSIRGGLEWSRFCEIKIPLPNIDDQKKYTSIYNSLLKNQTAYYESIDHLQFICELYIENLFQVKKTEKLSKYIEQSEERNIDGQIDNLLGISVDKIFIETRSKKENLNLTNYKIVRHREFGYVSVTSRNGDKISIALLNGNSGLVSSTYVVFRVIDINKLLPEYLYLYFCRPEFDRYSRFHSWGSARETFDWEDMCSIELPIPSIKEQQAIVTIYHALENRKKINLELINQTNKISPILVTDAIEKLKNSNQIA